jgi:hypothetical protein
MVGFSLVLHMVRADHDQLVDGTLVWCLMHATTAPHVPLSTCDMLGLWCGKAFTAVQQLLRLYPSWTGTAGCCHVKAM